MRRSFGLIGAIAALVTLGLGTPMASAHDPNTPAGRESARQFLMDKQPVQNLRAVTGAPVACAAGQAAGYPCSNVDLQSFLPLAQMGGGDGNDIWGWTDPTNNREYALVGRTNGTSFVDVTDGVNPKYLGNLPTHTNSSPWRDLKVYQNHVFIGSEAAGHGLQVFDLTRLRGVGTAQTWTEDAFYGGFGNSHNIVINEASGYLYAVGTSTCSGGLHMVDIRVPTSPKNAGCFSADGYVHDAQCVNYAGPDARYVGREICFNSDEDTLTIVDVTIKSAPQQIARVGYAGAAYTHQGWLTEDSRYWLMNDEQDETTSLDKKTKTYTWDLLDLEAPKLIGTFRHPVDSIDHNLYIKSNYAYEANYRSGLRILDISGVASGSLRQAGYFDIYPASDGAEFNGAWSTYPYFASGNVIVNGIEQGLFVVKPRLGGSTPTPTPTPTSTATPTPTTTTTTTPPPPPSRTFASTAGSVIADNSTVENPITVADVPGNATSTVSVTVDITHTYRGDLVIDLVAPDGTAYNLKRSNGNDAADNVRATFTVNASSEVANGTWKLRVKDAYRGDTGRLNGWKLTV